MRGGLQPPIERVSNAAEQQNSADERIARTCDRPRPADIVLEILQRTLEKRIRVGHPHTPVWSPASLRSITYLVKNFTYRMEAVIPPTPSARADCSAASNSALG